MRVSHESARRLLERGRMHTLERIRIPTALQVLLIATVYASLAVVARHMGNSIAWEWGRMTVFIVGVWLLTRKLRGASLRVRVAVLLGSGAAFGLLCGLLETAYRHWI